MLTLDIPLTEITHNQFQQSTLYTIKIKKRDFKAHYKTPYKTNNHLFFTEDN